MNFGAGPTTGGVLLFEEGGAARAIQRSETGVFETREVDRSWSDGLGGQLHIVRLKFRAYIDSPATPFAAIAAKGPFPRQPLT